MSLLLNHFEQVASSARTIGELPFPPPKIFTNALLGNHEITTLIRDTEPHERALFSIDPQAKALPGQRRSDRRLTTCNPTKSNLPVPFNAFPRKESAVSRVLGSEILQEIEGYQRSSLDRKSRDPKSINIEALLKGAEKLFAIYPVAGASEKIASLRNRNKQVAESVALYEAKVASQTAQLDRMSRNKSYPCEDDDFVASTDAHPDIAPVTEDELRAEEQEIKDLEQKKLTLEERIASMDKDLGGLLR